MSFTPMNEDEYEQLLLSSIRQGVKDPLIYNKLGVFYLNANRLDEAEEWFRKAIELNPRDSTFWHNLGIVKYNQKWYDEALPLFRKAADIMPTDYESMAYYGLCTFFKGHRDEGLHLVETITRTAPMVALAWRSLGLLYSELRRQTDAVRAYMQAVALDPDHQSSFLTLKKLLEESGREVTKIMTDEGGVITIGKRGIDGQRVVEKVITIPRRKPEVWTKTSEFLRTSTGMKEVKSGESASAMGGGIDYPDHVVTCPQCGAPIPLFEKMIRPDGNVRCENCFHLFRNPLQR